MMMKNIYLRWLLLVSIIGFIACECDDPTDPSCPNYDPCWGVDYEETNADFTIYECVKCSWDDSMMVIADTVIGKVVFEANQEFESYEWQVGSDPRTFTEKRFTLDFLDNEGSITVRLIGKKTPNLDCFPDDDGIDTVTKVLQVVDYDESLIWGKYQGYDEDEPDSLYTIEVFRDSFYNNLLNFPRGCPNRGLYGISFIPGYSVFLLSNDRGSSFIECKAPEGRGYIQEDGKTLVIDYSIEENRNRIAKKFIGQKIE